MSDGSASGPGSGASESLDRGGKGLAAMGAETIILGCTEMALLSSRAEMRSTFN